MADTIWAASGIHSPELSKPERDRLAVLRVTFLAADPTAEKPHFRHDTHLALEVVAEVDPWSDMVLRGPRLSCLSTSRFRR